MKEGPGNIDREKLRAMAREAARFGRAPDVSGLSMEQVGHLFYEFGVYQAELQAQNDELADLRARLESERDRFMELYNLAPVGYMTLDAEAKILEANLTLCDMLGKARKELIGRKFEKYIAPDHQAVLGECVLNAIIDEKPQSCKLELLKAGGKISHVSLEVHRVCGRKNRDCRCLAAVMDVSAQTRMERDLVEARARAEAASQAKSAFLANMSHELRTPLTGVMGMLQLLEREGLAPRQRRFLRIAMNSSESLLTIINDILDLSKIEAGKMHLEQRVFKPAAEVRRFMEIFRIPAEEKGLRLITVFDKNLPESLVGDPVRLRQILFNLVGNALKFTHSGSISVKMADAGYKEPGTRRLSFVVSDTGIGMSEEMLSRVFKPFEQAENEFAKKIAGSGLGLAIVKRLVDLMEGSISVQSTADKGTTVSFSLPMREPEAGQAAREMACEPKTAGDVQREQRAYNILLAEDNAVNQLATMEFLKEYGHKLTVVGNGREALEQLDKGGFDLVLMDVQMPVMDGLEAARRIRETQNNNRDIPIIALTAYALDSDKERILDAGMDAHISKPYDYEELNALIHKIVAEKPKSGLH